jgi:hypothetical protein
LSALRVTGDTLRFHLAAPATLTLRLERRSGGRWLLVRRRSLRAKAGEQHVRLARRLRRGTWRATMSTPGATTSVRFRLR